LARDEPTRAVANNGLAEILLQSGKFEDAHDAAQTAYQLAPDAWVAAYTLGRAEVRLPRSEDAFQHPDESPPSTLPDAPHRLLTHLYRAGAYIRLGNVDAALESLDAIKRHRGGLNEWQNLLPSDQAEALRDTLQGDIRTAQALADGELDIKAL